MYGVRLNNILALYIPFLENIIEERKNHCLSAKNVVLYDEPLSLEDIGVSYAPQSYCYLSMPG